MKNTAMVANEAPKGIEIPADMLFEYVYTRDLRPYTETRPFDPKNRGRRCGVVIARTIALPSVGSSFVVDGAKCKRGDKFDINEGLRVAMARIRKQIDFAQQGVKRKNHFPASLAEPLKRMAERAEKYYKVLGLPEYARPEFKSFKK